ncbi:hypothetical protein JHK82_054078 [Glycine max]|nr:hypothetical protein JHK86_053926 [Glycine max]KAG5083913.1 hypothetical protein JHK84_053951 [Glycine max]KAG5086681.1 hypothetical protein JHK82_054078 [Glycine max]
MSSSQLPSSSPDFETVNSLPRPLECLQGNPVRALFSKTFDLVDDPSLDPIISWGSSGVSFVVWDRTLFARHVLPRNFKHNNFSSFVRLLNTYVGTLYCDKNMVQIFSYVDFRTRNGSRRSALRVSTILGISPSAGSVFRKINTDKWEFFNEAFQRGKRHLLKNIRRCGPPQSHQVGSYIVPYSDAGKAGLEFEIESLRKDRSVLMQEVLELQQQQRTTLQCAKQHEKEQRDIGSPKVRRKFVKQHQCQTGISDFLNDGHIALAKELSEGAENMISDELATVHEKFFNLTKGAGFPELSPLETERIIKQEDKWNTSFNASGAPSRFGNEQWGNPTNYEVPEFGVTSGMSDMWDINSLLATESFPTDDSTLDEIER